MKLAAAVAIVSPILLVGCATGPHEGTEAQSLIHNGSFETPTADAPYVRVAPGLPLAGWTIANGPIDLVGHYWRPAEGKQSIHIARGATVSQNLSTKAGQSYELRFAAAANADSSGDNPIKHLLITWGDKRIGPLELDSRTHSREEMGWRHFAYPVKASGEHMTLRFSCEEKGEWGVALDDVRVTPVVNPTTSPSPTTSPRH